MSLVVTVYVPSGIVMAGDSRVTATRREEKKEEQQTTIKEQQVVLSDHGYKVIALDVAPVGVSCSETAIINNEPIDSHIRKFAEQALAKGDNVSEVASKLVSYFESRFPKVPVGFHVCGYQVEKNISVPYIYTCHTVRETSPVRRNVNPQGNVVYGLTFSGETSVIKRLISKDFVPRLDAMPLQDAIDYAIHLIRTTIDTLRFEPRFPTVGGAIDVLVITPPSKLNFVQRKELHGG
ncbi:MAG: hypothetical protein KAX23_06185 [Dehalococcoidia bacterium]|jgi:hypothetical protein|nr:hypothetical protein [Chloroflexota bacterium]MCK4243119.1 hypothetical protein [Dehalococcoidia bacterium]